jgi:hypothetical protein
MPHGTVAGGARAGGKCLRRRCRWGSCAGVLLYGGHGASMAAMSAKINATKVHKFTQRLETVMQATARRSMHSNVRWGLCATPLSSVWAKSSTHHTPTRHAILYDPPVTPQCLHTLTATLPLIAHARIHLHLHTLTPIPFSLSNIHVSLYFYLTSVHLATCGCNGSPFSTPYIFRGSY